MTSPDVGDHWVFVGRKSKWLFHISLDSNSMYTVFFGLIYGVKAKFKTRFAGIGSIVCLGRIFTPKCIKNELVQTDSSVFLLNEV